MLLVSEIHMGGCCDSDMVKEAVEVDMSEKKVPNPNKRV